MNPCLFIRISAIIKIVDKSIKVGVYMITNWYVSVNGETYGPYTWESMYEQSRTGNIVVNTMVYHEEIGQWVEARSISAFGFESTSQMNNQEEMPNTTSQKPIKKKSGCLKGCLSVLLVMVIGLVLISVFVIRPTFNKDMIDLGRNKVVLKDKVSISGGSIKVDDDKSIIDGLEITVPQDGYDEEVDFKVSTREIKEHDYGDAFNPILPLIHIDNGGGYSNEFMEVSVPIDIDDDMFAMALYYNEDGSLEPIPQVSQTNNELVFGARHFSDVVITALPKALLEEYVGSPEFDTGFRPMVDNWPFVNRGAELSAGGSCNGMSLSAIHYYNYHKKNGEPPLFSYIDNNFYKNTPDFEYDDSQGIRLASIVQGAAKFEYTRKWHIDALHKNKFMTDKQVFYHFAYSFLLSKGDPQVVGLFVREMEDGKPKISAGHAIVAYKMDATGIYVCDPNYPTRTDLKIPFDGSNFGIYNTATRAGERTYNYNSFSLLGTSSIVPSYFIENLFSELKENPYESTIGDDKLSNPNIDFLAIDDGEIYWTKNIESIVITPEDAVVYKDAVTEFLEDQGYLENFNTYKPRDWEEKAYLPVLIKPDTNKDNKYIWYTEVQVYKADNTRHIHESYTPKEGHYYYIPLEEGINNLGFKFRSNVAVGRDDNNQVIYRKSYVDYQRVQITYGELDLTGTWKGEFQINNMDNAIDYAEDLSYQITKGIGWIITQMTGEEFSDADLREIASAGVEVKEGITDPMPISVTLSNKKGNQYDAKVIIETDGIYEYSVPADFDGQALVFSLLNEDGSRFEYAIEVTSKTSLDGEFIINYGSVNEFVTGTCELKKE